MTHDTTNKTHDNQSGGLNETIKRAKQELEHLIDLNPTVMLLIDANTVIIRANKALLRLLNRHRFDEVLTKRLDEIFQFNDPSFVKNFTSEPRDDKTCQTMATIPDQGLRLLEFTLIGSESAPDLLSVIVEDITTAKELSVNMEKELKKEAVNALAGALMHHINQPLTVIMIKAQLAQLAIEDGSPKANDLRNELQSIVRSAAQIAGLLENAANSKDYITEPYTPKTHILDIARSAGIEDQIPYYAAVINALIAALEAHSPGSALHCRRTSEYAAFLAKCMGLTNAEIETVRRCAVLHDIGKIGVPETLLHKPGPLTDKEKNIIKQHVEIATNILSVFPFMEKESAAIRSNHEHFDGSGYPHGIKGDDIPYYARIVAVADAYDALHCDRPYHAGIKSKDAVKEISAHAGTHFDPTVVKELEEHHEEMNSFFQ